MAIEISQSISTGTVAASVFMQKAGAMKKKPMTKKRRPKKKTPARRKPAAKQRGKQRAKKTGKRLVKGSAAAKKRMKQLRAMQTRK